MGGKHHKVKMSLNKHESMGETQGHAQDMPVLDKWTENYITKVF